MCAREGTSVLGRLGTNARAQSPLSQEAKEGPKEAPLHPHTAGGPSAVTTDSTRTAGASLSCGSKGRIEGPGGARAVGGCLLGL